MDAVAQLLLLTNLKDFNNQDDVSNIDDMVFLSDPLISY